MNPSAPMHDKLRYFYASFGVTAGGIACAWLISPEHFFYTAYLISILALLEVALSFDNAVINAGVLHTMPAFWQKLFLWLGLPVAVFGMRLVFPILLVGLTSDMGFYEVVHIAIYAPEVYHKALEEGLPLICAFGSGFLCMLFLKFLFTEEHQPPWIRFIEQGTLITRLRQLPLVSQIGALVIGGVLTITSEITLNNGLAVSLSFLSGVVTHELLQTVSRLFQGNTSVQTANNGLMGFLYLEVLDASFSFDGVIGAFAISTNIFVIMLGLGIGAMFVRSLTLFFVAHRTLARFPYLEAGAHYAIGTLAVVLMLKVFVHVPEWLAGSLSIGFIVSSFIHSHLENKRTR